MQLEKFAAKLVEETFFTNYRGSTALNFLQEMYKDACE